MCVSRLEADDSVSKTCLLRLHWRCGPAVLEPISHAQAGNPIVMNISPVTYREVSGWLRKHVAVVSMIVFLCSCSVRLFLAERADPRERRRSLFRCRRLFGPGSQPRGKRVPQF